MSFHFCADDSQLYTTFTFTYNNDSDQDRAVQCIEACLADIKKWMALNELKLKGNKSELVIFHPRHRPPSVNIGSEVAVPTDSVRNSGAIFDKTMTMLPHINSVCKGSFPILGTLQE